MGKAPADRDARAELVATAAESFYRRGVTATGVDTITRESGVSKPTLYSHFRSKHELVTAALQWQHDRRREALQAYLDGIDEQGVDRIPAVFDWLAGVSAEAGFRGCAFLNAAAELVAPADEPARAVAREHKDWWRGLFTGMAAEAGLANSEELGEELLLLLDGAYARLAVDGTERPMRVARNMARVLIAESSGNALGGSR